jgi:EmrB/QacA subfamily drug resistance transporter
MTTTSRQRYTLAIVCVAVFMLLIDTTVVSVSLPSISRALKPSFAELQWVIDAYATALAVVLLTAGAVSDFVGRRRVFALGLALFTATSLLCAQAWTPLALDFGRAAQGVGGAMMLATSLALIAQEFPPGQRKGALAVWGATSTLALALGPLLGGALTSAFGWRSVFLVNVPIGVALLLLTLTCLVDRPGPPRSLDLAGLALFSVGLLGLLLAITRGNDDGWGSVRILTLLGAGAALLAVFVVVESRRDAPMLDLSLFRKPTFVGAAVAALATMAALGSLIFYITTWFQTILGYSPIQAGLRGSVTSGAAFAAALVASRACKRVPLRYPLSAGLVLIAAGDVVMHRVGPTSGWTALLPGMILAGAGLGLTAAPLAESFVGVVPPWKSGMASGTGSTFRQIGLAAGIAASGAVFQAAVSRGVTGSLAGSSLAGRAHGIASAIVAGQAKRAEASAPAAQRPLVHHAAQVGFAAGLSEIFLIAAAVAAAGSLLAFALVRAADLVAMPVGRPPEARPVPAAAPAAVASEGG